VVVAIALVIAVIAVAPVAVAADDTTAVMELVELVAAVTAVTVVAAAVMELVELVAAVTAVTVVAAGLAAKMDRVDSNVYRVNTIQHLLAVENGVVLLGLEQRVQDLSLPARRSPCNHKHDRPWR
jgi:hypothetical protein